MDVEIEDIAHGLARVARWNGQTKGEHAFSVAEHSVLVEQICRRLEPGLTAEQSLTALLHDGPEYVIGDMISPFKALLGESLPQLCVPGRALSHMPQLECLNDLPNI